MSLWAGDYEQWPPVGQVSQSIIIINISFSMPYVTDKLCFYVGDFAQVSHCCNQAIKYNDVDYDDVISAAEFAEEMMQSLLSRRKDSSLQVNIICDDSSYIQYFSNIQSFYLLFPVS